MNPSDRYFRIRALCKESGGTVPWQALRAHLDFVRHLQRQKAGLHPIVITIGQDATQASLDLFPHGLDAAGDIILRAAGQHYGPNRV